MLASRTKWLVSALLIILALAIAPHAIAQPAPDSGTTATLPLSTVRPPMAEQNFMGRILRIGYLRLGTDWSPSPAQMEELARFMERRPALRDAMSRDGFTTIGLYPCEGGEDMLRRLDAAEFDVAFSPAKSFSLQRFTYVVALQTRRAEDLAPARDAGPLRDGVVFVSRRHPLFRAEAPTAEDIRRGLLRRPLAVVSSQSLAGFVVPVLTLARDYRVYPGEVELVWFDSSEEVVKAVVSGLADAGIAESGAVTRLAARAEPRTQGSMVRVVVHAPPVPTDPVLLRLQFDPSQSTLGRELRDALRDFAAAGGFGDLQLLDADPRAYERVPAILSEFELVAGTLRP